MGRLLGRKLVDFWDDSEGQNMAFQDSLTFDLYVKIGKGKMH